LIESLSAGPELRKHVEKAKDFLDKVQTGYQKDPLFSKIILEKDTRPSEKIMGLFTLETAGDTNPRVVTKDYSLTAMVIEQAHTILGHLGAKDSGLHSSLVLVASNNI
jgi:hypothetical protein